MSLATCNGFLFPTLRDKLLIKLNRVALAQRIDVSTCVQLSLTLLETLSIKKVDLSSFQFFSSVLFAFHRKMYNENSPRGPPNLETLIENLEVQY